MTEPAPKVDLRPDHWAIVRDALRRHVPDREVLAFGSRATWTAKDYSDLDLAVMGDEPLSLRTAAALDEALGDSDLPFKVDVVDWARIDDGFRSIIRRHGVSVQARLRNPTATRPAGDPLTTGAEATEQSSQLGIYAEIVMGQSPPGSTTNTSGDGVPLLNGPTEFGPHHPAPSQFTTNPRKMANPGDLLFCVRGSTTGRMNWADQEYAIGRGVAALRHKHGHHLQPFVRGVVEFSLPELLSQATGSTFPNVSARQLATVWWPPLKLSEQHAIAQVLGTLDDKIELNRRMNKTLAAVAEALFKSWFVDFDPVRAKVEGRDLGLPPDIADLFPDRLVDSEMGEVPEGWVHETVYRFADIVYGAPFASKRFTTGHQGVPLIRIRDLATHNPSVSTEQVHDKGHLIDPGDIVVGMDGAFRLEVWKGPTSWLNQRVCHFEARSGIPTSFVAGALQEPLAFFERAKVGTTVIHLGKRDLDTIRLLHPGQEVLDAFGKTGEPLLEKAVANSREARNLAALRDTLLPKLISGEIRVPDAERAVESVP